MDKVKLTDLEEKFCWVYASGPAPYNGNAKETYNLVFNKKARPYMAGEFYELAGDEMDTEMLARQLVLREDIKARIEQIQSDSMVSAATLRPRLTETLLRIADECSTLVCVDKFGTKISPAALRSVAVNAIGKLTDMYGIKEDIAHKVMLEGADGDGITFNLIVPQGNKDNEMEKIVNQP